MIARGIEAGWPRRLALRAGQLEDQYETALLDLINQKRAGKPIIAKERPRGENVVDLMDALRKSIGGGAAATEARWPEAVAPLAAVL